MPFQHKRLVGPLALTTSSALVYTVPANKTSIIKQVVVTNTTGSSATFTLRIGTTNAIFNAVTVAANDSLLINLSQVLTTAETLYALASANSTLNLTISGVENEGPIEPTETYIADGAVTAAKLANTAGAVMVHNDSSARLSSIPSPVEGMVTYLKDTDTFWYYTGSSWTSLGNVISFADTSARDVGLAGVSLAGRIVYIQDIGELQFNDGTWKTVVTTADDQPFSNLSSINANIGGADGGLSLRQWTGGASYQSLATANMTGDEYMVISDGTSTWISAGVGGSVYLRAGNNNSNYGMIATSTYSAVVAAGGNAIVCDTSAYVSMQYQPAFSAYHQTGGSVVFPVGNLVFNTTRFNQGSSYNASTGRFTAPQGGKYFFHTAFFKYTTYSNASNTYWGFNVNDSSYHWINHGAQGYDGGQSLSCLVSLNTGDYVTVYTQSSIETYREWYNTFEGWKVA